MSSGPVEGRNASRDPRRHDPWEELRSWTDARIALGHAGNALPTDAVLDFQLDHARARDAVGIPWDSADLGKSLAESGRPYYSVVSRANGREEYLRRPDLGRLLATESEKLLESHSGTGAGSDAAPDAGKEAEREAAPDLCFVVADGLSSLAVSRQAAPTLANLLSLAEGQGYTTAPIVLARQARVALGDEIASRLRSRVSIVLIGERPGLSSPDSLGIYLTFDPRPGRQNAERNCISNIRPGGLSHEEAARRCLALIRGALLLGCSGIGLKEDSYLGSF